jgi:hypothetical protein
MMDEKKFWALWWLVFIFWVITALIVIGLHYAAKYW